MFMGYPGTVPGMYFKWYCKTLEMKNDRELIQRPITTMERDLTIL
jgi:hypothetical protein